MAAQYCRSSSAHIVEAVAVLGGCKTSHTQLLLIKCTYFVVLLHNKAKITSACLVCFGMFLNRILLFDLSLDNEV